MKHTVLINWLVDLGFETLESDIEITGINLKASLAVLLNNMTDEMMTCLEKSNKNLEAIKKVKISDAKFVGNLLKFINGSLDSEFGIKIKRKSKNSEMYILSNNYIKKNYMFLNPFEPRLYKHANSPILGIVKDTSPIRISEEPYDSDDDL